MSPASRCVSRLGFISCIAAAVVPATGSAQSPSGKRALGGTIDFRYERPLSELCPGLGVSLADASVLGGFSEPGRAAALADLLNLSDRQRIGAAEIMSAMQAESIPVANKLAVQMAELRARLARGELTEETHRIATQGAAASHARLKAIQAKYYPLMAELLTPAQVRRYNELRASAGCPAVTPADPAR